jgi:hypothetical protein
VHSRTPRVVSVPARRSPPWAHFRSSTGTTLTSRAGARHTSYWSLGERQAGFAAESVPECEPSPRVRDPAQLFATERCSAGSQPDLLKACGVARLEGSAAEVRSTQKAARGGANERSMRQIVRRGWYRHAARTCGHLARRGLRRRGRWRSAQTTQPKPSAGQLWSARERPTFVRAHWSAWRSQPCRPMVGGWRRG